MTQEAERMRRVTEAARRIAASVGGREGVVFIDVGLRPGGDDPVVRVHVRAEAQPPEVPPTVDDVDVIVLTTDARFEEDQ